MFEELLKEKINTNLDLLDLSLEYYNLYAIMESNFDDSFKKFASADTEYKVNSLLSSNAISSNFNFENESDSKDNIVKILEQNAIYTISDMQKLINKEMYFSINFLLRPIFTVKYVLFRNQDECSVRELQAMMKYFSQYTYLTSGILFKIDELGYVLEHKIKASEFKDWLREIDIEMIFSLSPEDFVELCSPIYDFFNMLDEDSNENIVPTEALMIFFDDKGLSPLVKFLKDDYNQLNLQFITKSKLLEFIVRMIESDQEVSEEEDEEEILVVESSSHSDSLNEEISNIGSEDFEEIPNPDFDMMNEDKPLFELNLEEEQNEILNSKLVEKVGKQDFEDVEFDSKSEVNAEDYDNLLSSLESSLSLEDNDVEAIVNQNNEVDSDKELDDLLAEMENLIK